MKLGSVIGRVTLSKVVPELIGARWLIVSPFTRVTVMGRMRKPPRNAVEEGQRKPDAAAFRTHKPVYFRSASFSLPMTASISANSPMAG